MGAGPLRMEAVRAGGSAPRLAPRSSFLRDPGRPSCRQPKACVWGALALTALVAAHPGPGAAQEAPAGALRGTVVDADFSQGLAGVRVVLEGTDRAAVTDDDGIFFLNELPPATYVVGLSKEGYIRQRYSDILVSPGAVKEIRLEISSDVVELEEFVVSAEDLIADEAVNLLDVRQSMVQFADVIGAEFIAATGASDAGEALAKIVGTSVVDSRYVVVRGLSDRYNTVVLNGARIPSSDPDKRAVNVDIFPGGLIETLSNTKTFSPNVPGESTGGYINIITKSIPTGPFVKFSVKTGYNIQATGNGEFVSYRGGGVGFLGTKDDRELPGFIRGTTLEQLDPSQGFVPLEVQASRDFAARELGRRATGVTVKEAPMDFSFSAEAGTQFDLDGHALGLLAGISYSKDYRFDPETEIARYRYSPNSRTSLPVRRFVGPGSQESLLAAILLAAGYEVTEDDTVKLTFFSNIAAEDEAFFQWGGSLGSQAEPDDTRPLATDRPIFLREALQYKERRLSTIQLAGDHVRPDSGDTTINWVAAYSESSQDEPDQRFTNVTFSERTGFYGGAGPEWPGEQIERLWRRLEDDNYFLGLDVETPLFDDGSGNSRIMFGASFDRSTREYEAENFAYIFAASSPAIVPLTIATPNDRRAVTLGDQIATLDRLPAEIRGTRARDRTVYLFRNGLPETYSARQTITSGYGMITTDVTEDLQLMFGARAEFFDLDLFRDLDVDNLTSRPDADATAAISIDLNTGEPIPADELGTARVSEVNVLPAASATWDFTDNMKLRTAFSRTVARPSFKELAPVFTRDPGSGDRFVGVPSLRTSNITNADVRWEWFLGEGDIIAASAFTKLIEDPIELNSRGGLLYFRNEDEGNLYGFELEAQKNLGFLDEAFEDISLQANYTALISSVEVRVPSERRAAGLSTNRRLQGQPDYIFNFNMTYDNKDTGWFSGLFLNVTGELLYAVGGLDDTSFVQDVFQKPITSLDFVISKKFAERWKLSFRAENLTNHRRERKYTSGALYEAYQSGTTYSLSLSGEW